MSRIRRGFVVLTLRSGEARNHVPARTDCLAGARRSVSDMGGGRLDRVLSRAGGFRVQGVFTSRYGLGRIGDQATHFSDEEEALGLSRTYSVQLADARQADPVVSGLRDLDVVESAGPDLLATAPAAQQAGLAGHRVGRAMALEPRERIGAPAALAREPGDARVAVAVVDTGASLGHPELQRRLLAGFDCVDLGLGEVADGMMLVGDSRGHDFSPEDDVGHGSHVCGVIGAHGWQIPPGVAGEAQVLPIRVLAAAHQVGSTGLSGVGSLPDIDQGVKAATDLGADVINMSFGTAEDDTDPQTPAPHQAVIRYAARHGVILVAAAGNNGQRTRYFPAAHPEVIAVGSVDSAERRSPFSSFGDHVLLYAPGERIVSIGRQGYRISTGTSHAAPFVSGSAALLVARARRRGAVLDTGRLRSVLMRSGLPLPHEPGSVRLDIDAALDLLDRELAAQVRPDGRTNW